MKKKLEKTLQEILPAGDKNRNALFILKIMISGLLLVSTLLAFFQTWGTQAPPFGSVVLLGIAGLGSGFVIWILKKYWKPAMILLLAPWLIMLIYMGMGALKNGFLAWVNLLFMNWNINHINAIVYFSINATQREILLFSMFLAVVTGELIWLLTIYQRIYLSCIYGAAWCWILLMSGNFHALTCALMVIGLFVMWLGRRKFGFTITGLLWTGTITVVFLILALAIPATSIKSIDRAREQITENIQDFRYGEDTLPQGDLYQSGQLKQRADEMLRVQTEQTKALYLRGYTGISYENGYWLPPVKTMYMEDDAGMLTWLARQGFEPQTQVADYYNLCEEDKRPERNQVQVDVLGASSYYVYAPSSAWSISDARITEKQDAGWKNKGFRGDRSYGVSEVSDVRPAELTVVADWVNDPQTQEQKRYCEAENVYRNFVYKTYTQIDDQMYDLMQDTFWKDYQSDADGIYSAVTQIRTVLNELVQYEENPAQTPETEDPIRWFLEESHTGNDVQYASVAVEAFRAHGIPARYVEGYYLASSDISASQDETLTLTGKNAHAWAEVYFDGIGWLPIDVTPGYYYDAVSLQQLVGTPDTVHKKAALENNHFGTDQIQNMQQSGVSQKLPETLKKVWDVTKIVLGVVAILLVILILAVAVLELIRILRIYRERRRYQKSSSEEKVNWLQRYIYHFMWLAGIETGLGWNTEETDTAAAELFPGVEKGEYANVTKLLEKSVYGEETLETYEERTILAFLYKVVDYRKTADWKQRFRFRYHAILSSHRNARKYQP